MRTAIDFESKGQITNFCIGSQEVWANNFAKCNSIKGCQALDNVLRSRAWWRSAGALIE
jgi:hypothetical protein